MLVLMPNKALKSRDLYPAVRRFSLFVGGLVVCFESDIASSVGARSISL